VSVRMDDEGATTSAARPIASPTLSVTAKRSWGQGWRMCGFGRQSSASFSIRSHANLAFWLRRRSAPRRSHSGNTVPQDGAVFRAKNRCKLFIVVAQRMQFLDDIPYLVQGAKCVTSIEKTFGGSCIEILFRLINALWGCIQLAWGMGSRRGATKLNASCSFSSSGCGWLLGRRGHASATRIVFDFRCGIS
jgi:hypothetical protein